MKQFFAWVAFLLVLACCDAVVADESLPPVPIGSGQTTTVHIDGQVLQISAAGINAAIYFDTVSATQVAGTAVRTSPGTSSGDVTILWVNQAVRVAVHLSLLVPDVPFSMVPTPVRAKTLSQIKSIYRGS